MDFSDLGRTLLIVGGAVVLLGLVLMLAGNIPFIGRLPGDFSFDLGPVKVFAPIATMILLSVVLTIVLNLLSGVLRR